MPLFHNSEGKDIHVELGDHVLVHGTGSRWRDLSFSATVVDIRNDDETIKVQYRDGGYKRFKISEFIDLIKKEDDVDESDFGMNAYEFNMDQYDPTTEMLETVQGLRRQQREAIKNRDFLLADSLKDDIEHATERTRKLRIAQEQLFRALKVQDFKRCHEIQQELDSLRELETKEVAEKMAEIDIKGIFNKSLHRALNGGLAGALAMTAQVVSLMWMRTTMNYQYRHGMSTKEALRTLYKEGGIGRFYKGIIPALAQGPLSRFGDTAANTGILTLLNAHPSTRDWDVGRKTVIASTAAALWRIVLMPVDTIKTSMQVSGDEGIKLVKEKIRKGGPQVMFHGSLAAAGATFAGHFPWFFTFNFLDSHLPTPETFSGKLVRSAGMGFSASVVSDTVSNSIRVVKTYRQTHHEVVPYSTAIKSIVEEEGMIGLFGRGLKTRILANGMQGLMFSVVWKYLDGRFQKSSSE